VQLFGFANLSAKYFFKEKMWESLNPIAIGSQGVALQLPLTSGFGEVATLVAIGALLRQSVPKLRDVAEWQHEVENLFVKPPSSQSLVT